MKENQYSHMKYWMDNVYKDGKYSHKNSCVLKNVLPIMKKIQELVPINKDTRVLDVGCGSGNFTYQFSCISNSVIGVDHSEYIFRKNPHNKLLLMDGTRMAFKDNSFDVVFCSDTLHHIPEYEKTINEMLRVSKGYVIILEANPLNPLIFGVGLVRKEERILIKKPLTLAKIKRFFKKDIILFSKHVFSLFFPNALANVPEKVLNMFPKVRFIDNIFMPWFLIIVKKR